MCIILAHAYTEATAVQEAEWVINTLNAYGYTDWHLQAGIWYDYEEHRQLRNMINAGATFRVGKSYKQVTNSNVAVAKDVQDLAKNMRHWLKKYDNLVKSFKSY